MYILIKELETHEARIFIAANEDRKLIISGIHLQVVLHVWSGRALLLTEEESGGVCLVELVHPVAGFGDRH
jgi:hypothetical protein